MSVLEWPMIISMKAFTRESVISIVPHIWRYTESKYQGKKLSNKQETNYW